MSTSFFRIKEHVVPAQHIRSYPLATRTIDEDVLHIAVKQYIPLDNLTPKPGDITIIGAHANGFPKELYEPLWDELLHISKLQNWRIRSIWIADVAQQGWSSVLNEDKLGSNPGWFDHPRDLLHMINIFRSEMPQPLIGVGHSMGGNHLINLSLMHPRLLETLILIDPVAARAASRSGNWGPASASASRRDRWPSRKIAEESFRRSKFYQTWDPRVLDRWIKYGLRELPTKLYPDAQASSTATGSAIAAETTMVPNVLQNNEEKEVTLTTTKHQEVMTFLRPGLQNLSGQPFEKLLHPEIPLYADSGDTTVFYRSEPTITFHNLPFVRPSVFYIFGEESDLSAPEHRKSKMDLTGTGVGGSGGAKAGRVVEIVIQKTGHLIPMEKVEETARVSADWIENRMIEWRAGQEALKTYWAGVPESEKFTMDARYAKAFADLGLGRFSKASKVDKPKL